jgi:hypothetical protein
MYKLPTRTIQLLKIVDIELLKQHYDNFKILKLKFTISCSY